MNITILYSLQSFFPFIKVKHFGPCIPSNILLHWFLGYWIVHVVDGRLHLGFFWVNYIGWFWARVIVGVINVSDVYWDSGVCVATSHQYCVIITHHVKVFYHFIMILICIQAKVKLVNVLITRRRWGANIVSRIVFIVVNTHSLFEVLNESKLLWDTIIRIPS